jgi:hypothetical protein
MPFTQTELDTLNTAIAQGALTVEYGDKKVTYRSLTEMMQIKSLMERELAPASQVNNGRRFASFSKGLL